MKTIKFHTPPGSDVEKGQEHIDTHKVSKLGIPTDVSECKHEDRFTFFSPINVKHLISHLSSAYFENNKFNAKNYVDTDAYARKQKEETIENRKVEIDNLAVAQNKIFLNNTSATGEQLLQDVEELFYKSLSKSLQLNRTICYIDNDTYKNGYYIHYNKDDNLISFSYYIFYKDSEEGIDNYGNSYSTKNRHIALKLKEVSAGSVFFFVEKTYGKEAANDLKGAIYEEILSEFKNASDIETLVYLYDNLPFFMKRNYDEEEVKNPFRLPDELLWTHFMMFVDYDDGSDASFYVINTLTLMSPKYCMGKFLEDQSLVIQVYDGLDDGTNLGFYPYSETFSDGNNTFEPTNKDFFATLLNSYVQLYEGDSSVAVFENSGAYFHQGNATGSFVSVSGRRVDYELEYTLDSNIFFSNSDENKNKVYLTNKWEIKEDHGENFNQNGGVSNLYKFRSGYNEIGYFNPLDVVKFTQYDDKGEPITVNAPALFVKHASDVKEWEKVNEGIRLGVNVLMIIAGAATIYSGAGSLLLYAAIADMGLATTDIVIQSEKNNIKRLKGGAEFLESWEKIYNIGGLVTFSPVAIKAVTTYGPKMISSGAELLQVTGKTITNPEVYKKVKDLTTKAIGSLEIPNFNKTGLEILKKGFKSIPELRKAEKLQKLGVIFVKGGGDTMAAIYKGVVIAYGKAKIVARQLHRALQKLSGRHLDEYLDELVRLAGMSDNAGVIRNADRFLASAARLAKIEITAKNALKYLDEVLPHFNHEIVNGAVVQIGNKNCVSVVEAVEEYLRTGKITKAKPVKRLDVKILEKKYDGKFNSTKLPVLVDIMQEGERGIIYGIKERELQTIGSLIGASTDGHVFNVIKKGGKILHKDGQIGKDAIFPFKHYKEFQYLKTN
nr:hypothetical protein [uncultured Psychroserpens sp.]